MKKILSTAAAIALAASLISCGDSGDTTTIQNTSDVVLSIAAPVVTVRKAYAGVNYIAWNPVAQAKSYELYRTADGAANGTKIATVDNTQNTAYADIASTDNLLVDGVTYNYTVVALAANATGSGVVPSRAVYVMPNSTTVSITAYIPVAGTKIADFKDGITNYTKNFIEKYYKDAETIGKNASVDVVEEAIGGAKWIAHYPATAGFKFGLKLINKTQPDFIKASTTPAKWTDNYLEGYIANTSLSNVLGSGEYEAYLTMKSVCEFYPDEKVFSLGTKTIKALDVSTATGTPEAVWSADGKSVVLSWTPAVLKATNGLAPTTNYKVYRVANTTALIDGDTLVAVDVSKLTVTDKYTNADSDNVDTKVNANGTVVSGSKDTITKIYTLSDTVDNTVPYTYIVVNTADGEYENYKSTSISKYAQETTDAPRLSYTADVAKDSKNLYNQLQITAKRGLKADGTVNTKQTLALSYYKLDDVNVDNTNYTKTLDTSKFITLALANNDETEESWISYIDGATYGTYLLKLTATEPGKAPQSKYAIAYFHGATNVNVSTVNISATLGSETYSKKKAVIWDTGVDADTVGLYKYFLVTVKETRGTGIYNNYVTVSSKETAAKLEVVTVKGRSNRYDVDKTYVKDGFPQASSNTTDADPDKWTYTSYPYAVVDSIEGETGVTTTFSVKKVLAADSYNYKFSDNNLSNGKVTR